MSTIAFQEITNSSSDHNSFTAVLIHGLLGSGDDFVDFAKSLASSLSTSSDWRLILVDSRNHGRSVDREGLSPPHDMENSARDVANLFKSLNWGWPDVVIGHSVGGKVALQYVSSCAQGDYGDSAQLPKQLWILDAIPGKIETSQYDELGKALRALLTLPSPIPSPEWLVDHLVNLGVSKILAEYVSSYLKKSGEHYTTFSFNVEGALEMFESSRVTDYWALLEEPPKGMEIDLVRTDSQLTWDADTVKRLERLAKRESDESTGKFLVYVVSNSGHWVYKDQPVRLLEIMAPRMASLVQPDL